MAGGHSQAPLWPCSTKLAVPGLYVTVPLRKQQCPSMLTQEGLLGARNSCPESQLVSGHREHVPVPLTGREEETGSSPMSRTHPVLGSWAPTDTPHEAGRAQGPGGEALEGGGSRRACPVPATSTKHRALPSTAHTPRLHTRSQLTTRTNTRTVSAICAVTLTLGVDVTLTACGGDASPPQQRRDPLSAQQHVGDVLRFPRGPGGAQ